MFLSYSRPISNYQANFMELVYRHLDRESELDTILLASNAVDPLRQIVDAINSSAGLLALAFRRNLIGEGTQRIVLPDGTVQHRPLANAWLTSSYCHIEVALAFRAGIPLLILQEHDVVAEGVLDRSSTGNDVELIRKDLLPTTGDELIASPVGERIANWLRRVRREATDGTCSPPA